jgi:DNA recombination protein RmuC
MFELLVIISTLLSMAAIALLIVLLKRPSGDLSPLLARLETSEKNLERTERGLRDEVARNRAESAAQAQQAREEMDRKLSGFGMAVQTQITDIADLLQKQLDSFGQQLATLTQTNFLKLDQMRETVEQRLALLQAENSAKLDQARQESACASKLQRDEMAGAMKNFNDSVLQSIASMAAGQKQQFDAFTTQLAKLTETIEARLESLRAVVDGKLRQIQDDNARQLEQMRATVEEKLQGTLEKRLGESFKHVSDRLELVHKGLGEMQSLATGVGDLKRVLTNVKARGGWGEIQLEALLEQILSPDQFERNVKTNEHSNELVEFALKLPGRNDGQEVVWLPIDAKFPMEDYHRLVEAQERADAEAAEEAGRMLAQRIKACARTISEKYLNPPRTTEFGIMFLPTEGLYGEAVRRPDLIEVIQRECRVVLAGPMTLAALLNSLQMGFRTLAIQKRSSEVWNLLGAVKNEFGKFGDILELVKRKLDQASSTMEDAARKSRTIERKLRDVQELPANDSQLLLGEGFGEEDGRGQSG